MSRFLTRSLFGRHALTQSRSFASSRRVCRDNAIPANDPHPQDQRSPVSSTNAVATSSEGSFDKILQESEQEGEERRVMQSPDRATIWSKSQQPRSKAMVGPRFEQTIMEDQPRPLAAIELIHKQPVRWTKERTVSCDGGGGPLGHPRVYINVDKPQISVCTYCGLPFAYEKNKKQLEALPSTPYPLYPVGDPAEVPEDQSVTGAPFEHR